MTLPMSVPPPLTQPTHTLLYDGDCGLCDRTVQFLIRHDRYTAFFCVPQQSPHGQQILSRFNLPPEPASVIIIARGRIYTHSAAVIELYQTLGGPYAMLARVFWLIPRPLRDFAYRLISRWRYSIFGQARSCLMPPPGGLTTLSEADRFVG
jgi:predicted DCC family thiol-disulfide oxidoreductase YuxK